MSVYNKYRKRKSRFLPTDRETIKLLKKRYFSEKLFKIFGISSIAFSLSFLFVLILIIVLKGYSVFYAHKIVLPTSIFSTKNVDFTSMTEIRSTTITGFLKYFSNKDEEKSKREQLIQLLGKTAFLDAKTQLTADKKPEFIVLGLSSDVDSYLKNQKNYQLSDFQKEILEILIRDGKVIKKFNKYFFINADSRYADASGILSSVMGSVFIVFISLFFAFPLALFTAVYLEEYAGKNKFTDTLEILINNLAAIPSVVYGLFGLAIYLSFFALPRSSALVGGITISSMLLPTMVITTRQALSTVPQSLKDGVMALGASKMQVLLHHTIPLSLPGIMTGCILSIARALGETAPLIMIGMVAFIPEVPSSILDPSSALPVQIFLWSDAPEAGFPEKTAGAILVLLVILGLLNYFAIKIRKKFERRW